MAGRERTALPGGLRGGPRTRGQSVGRGTRQQRGRTARRGRRGAHANCAAEQKIVDSYPFRRRLGATADDYVATADDYAAGGGVTMDDSVEGAATGTGSVGTTGETDGTGGGDESAADEADPDGDGVTTSTLARHWSTNDALAYVTVGGFMITVAAHGAGYIDVSTLPREVTLAWLVFSATGFSWVFGPGIIEKVVEAKS